MPNEQKATRKLRAILSADVKGYSLLMADDEAFTIKTLKEYRRIMSEQIEQHNGRVVDAPGDNILAEFSSAVDAVQCTVEIQKILKDKNNSLPNDKRLEFRVGVNIGDVVQDGDSIYGAGVNVAARIEGLADPGGICISRNAYDHIKDKLKLGYEYLGDHEVKNIKEPVRVYKVLIAPEDAGKLIGEKKKVVKLKLALVIMAAVLVIAAGVLGGLYWKYLYLPAPSNIDPEDKMVFELPKGPAIAVLPFDNMTGDSELEYLCDGITDNIISALSYIPELFVIARNSTFAYKNRHLNVQQIGKELGARYVIEGSIQKSSKRIRIIVQLINANSGVHEWTETYDREFIDYLQLQDEIAFEILKAMNVKLTGIGNVRSFVKGIKDLHEYKKTIKGWNDIFHATPESNKMALNQAEELIEMNPENMDAFVLFASATLFNMLNGECDSQIICMGKASEAIRKALSIDNNHSRAHLIASQLFLWRKEHNKAMDSIKFAISLNPNYAHAYGWLGFIYACAGEPDKAIDYIKKAIRLNPLPPSIYYVYSGFTHVVAQQYKEAIEEYQKSIGLNPDNQFAYLGMVAAYGHMEDKENAKRALSELYRIYPEFSIRVFLKTMPFKKEITRDIFGEGCSKAGLTD